MVRKFAGMFTAAAIGMSVAVSGAHATTNIALGKPTASSSSTYGASSLAVDGNTDTTYAGGSIFQSGLDTNANWSVDLGANYSLSEVDIFQRTDELPRLLNNFSLTVFDTLGAVTFTQIYAPGPGDVVSTPFDVIFASPILGRSVQIILNGTDYLALAEVQVFGNTISDSDVPEPASMALLLFGLAGAAAARRAGRAAA